MRAVLCWTILGAAAIGFIAAEPRHRLSSVVSPDHLVALIIDDRRDEIGAAIGPIVANDERLRAFYSTGDGPAWVTGASTTRAADALQLLRSAGDHGLNPADYRESELSAALTSLDQTEQDDTQRIDRLAAFDVELTSAVLALGHDVAVGHTRPEAIAKQWKALRTEPDLAGTLREHSMDLDEWLKAIQPSHPQYVKLQQSLLDPAVRQDPEAVRVVALNLDRWRWMPDELGPNHLFVNIPAYELMAEEDGNTVFTMRVIVGKPTRRTPVLSSAMNTVVFSPYWNIPTSIASGETVPEAAQDPNYLQKRGIEIRRVSKGGATAVDPGQIDWNDQAQTRQLSFRQRPGAQNALGYVKFLFPNAFDVYLHDTPTDSLFGRTKRALSHGCVRLENPEGLAKYVLRGYEDWDGERIVTAMHSGNERAVKLSQTLPVHIAYFTAWVTDDGTVMFYPDVYGYEEKE